MTPQTFVQRMPSIAVVLLLLPFAACGPQVWQDSVTWSPDGRRAAVLVRQDLYVTDAQGRLSTKLADDVEAAAWLGGSERLVLARGRTVTSFREMAPALGPARAKEIAKGGEALLNGLRCAPDLFRCAPDAFEGAPFVSGCTDPVEIENVMLVGMYMRDNAPALIRSAFGDAKWREFDSFSVTLHSLVIAHIAADGRLVVDKTLGEQLHPIRAIRPAPGGRLIGLVAEKQAAWFGIDSSRDESDILVAPTDGAAAPKKVATQTTGYFDWTPDGHEIVYLTSWSWLGSDIFGTLEKTPVLETPGGVEVGNGVPLARVMFDRDAGVRCLKDGRVLFTAKPGEYPTANIGARDDTLFVFNGAIAPPSLSSIELGTGAERTAVAVAQFDVSPDETHVLVAGRRGEVLSLPLGGGPVEWVARPFPAEFKGTMSFPQPTWRAATEFTYARVSAAGTELVLHRGESDVVLSRNWDPEIVEALIVQQP